MEKQFEYNEFLECPNPKLSFIFDRKINIDDIKCQATIGIRNYNDCIYVYTVLKNAAYNNDYSSELYDLFIKQLMKIMQSKFGISEILDDIVDLNADSGGLLALKNSLLECFIFAVESKMHDIQNYNKFAEALASRMSHSFLKDAMSEKDEHLSNLKVDFLMLSLKVIDMYVMEIADKRPAVPLSLAEKKANAIKHIVMDDANKTKTRKNVPRLNGELYVFVKAYIEEMADILKGPSYIENDAVWIFKTCVNIESLVFDKSRSEDYFYLIHELCISEKNLYILYSQIILIAFRAPIYMNKILYSIFTTDRLDIFKTGHKDKVIDLLISHVDPQRITHVTSKIFNVLIDSKSIDRIVNFLKFVSQLKFSNEATSIINAAFFKLLVRHKTDATMQLYTSFILLNRAEIPINDFFQQINFLFVRDFYASLFKKIRKSDGEDLYLDKIVLEFLKLFLATKNNELLSIIPVVPYIPFNRDSCHLVYELYVLLFEKDSPDHMVSHLGFFLLRTPALTGIASSLYPDVAAIPMLQEKIGIPDCNPQKTVFLAIMYYCESKKLQNFNYTGIIDYIKDEDTIKTCSAELPIIIHKVHENYISRSYDFTLEYANKLMETALNYNALETSLLLISIILKHLFVADKRLLFIKDLHKNFKTLFNILKNRSLLCKAVTTSYTNLYNDILSSIRCSPNFYNYIILCLADVSFFKHDIFRDSHDTFNEFYTNVANRMKIIDEFPGIFLQGKTESHTSPESSDMSEMLLKDLLNIENGVSSSVNKGERMLMLKRDSNGLKLASRESGGGLSSEKVRKPMGATSPHEVPIDLDRLSLCKKENILSSAKDPLHALTEKLIVKKGASDSRIFDEDNAMKGEFPVSSLYSQVNSEPQDSRSIKGSKIITGNKKVDANNASADTSPCSSSAVELNLSASENIKDLSTMGESSTGIVNSKGLRIYPKSKVGFNSSTVSLLSEPSNPSSTSFVTYAVDREMLNRRINESQTSILWLIDVVYTRRNESFTMRTAIDLVKHRLTTNFQYEDLYVLLKIYNILCIREKDINDFLLQALSKGLDFKTNPQVCYDLSLETSGFYKFFFRNLYTIISGNFAVSVPFPSKEELTPNFSTPCLILLQDTFRRTVLSKIISKSSVPKYRFYFFNVNKLGIVDALSIVKRFENSDLVEKSLRVFREKARYKASVDIKGRDEESDLGVDNGFSKNQVYENRLSSDKQRPSLNEHRPPCRNQLLTHKPPVHGCKTPVYEYDSFDTSVFIRDPTTPEESLIYDPSTLGTDISSSSNQPMVGDSLSRLSSKDLIFYVPQLVQTLRNPAACNAIMDTLLVLATDEFVCHQLIWNLRANLYKDEMKLNRDPCYNVFLNAINRIMENMSPASKLFYSNEMSFLDSLTQISSSLLPYLRCSKEEKTKKINELLGRVQIPKNVYLPHCPEYVVESIVPNSGRALQSHAKVPFMASFVVRSQSNVKCVKQVIFKFGDDCRQDMLALQLISMFKSIFQEANLDIYLYPYKVVATDVGCGAIEVIPNSKSRDQIGREKINNLCEYFEYKFGYKETQSYIKALNNFVSSLAGYSLVAYFLNVKDRHNGNIMIDNQGRMIHIDFGYMLEISPGNLNIEVPLKLTKEIDELLGGPEGNAFKRYQELMVKGFFALRRRSRDLVMLTDLFMESGLNCFRKSAVDNFVSRFKFDLDDAEAAKFTLQLIAGSTQKLRTWVYDQYQKVTNNIAF